MKILGVSNVFLLFISLASADANAASKSAMHVRAEFIDGREAVIKDFCRTEDPGIDNNCGFNQHQSMVALYLPEKLGNVVLQHINHAKLDGFYDELTRKDFFHGHFLFPKAAHYDSPEEFFSDVTSVLYHSAEYNDRWRNEGRVGIPVLERRQRSFIGFLAGYVQKAVDLIAAPYRRTYIGAGTIYDDEIAMNHPELSGLDEHGQSAKPSGVKACKEVNGKTECRVCKPFGQFHIVKEAEGRFITANGEKVELYLRCFPEN